MGDDYTTAVTAEEFTTPSGLFHIIVFAAIAFGLFAFFGMRELRVAVLVVAVVIIGVMGALAFWFRSQEQYGTSTLFAKTPFAFGRRFEGWIQTELPAIPTGPVSVQALGWRWLGRNVTYTFGVKQQVAPSSMRLDDGRLRIPFALEIPGSDSARSATTVQCKVRASTFPFGWGATFVLV